MATKVKAKKKFFFRSLYSIDTFNFFLTFIFKLIKYTMYGGSQPTEEQKKLQEQYAYDTLKFAGIVAGALWVTPIVLNFIRKQL